MLHPTLWAADSSLITLGLPSLPCLTALSLGQLTKYRTG